MNNESEISNFDGVANGRAISLYDHNGTSEEFPILKAFQQYIDAEQAKARKRLISLGVFFGTLMAAVIAVFVVLLIGVTNRNQQLNDRLVDYAMKERSAASAPVVVQSPAPQDSATIVALTDKIESLRKELSDSQKRADAAAVEITKVKAEAAKPQGPSPEQLEIKRLKELLSQEKKAAEAEKERLHQLELEKYRREHYPELYAEKKIEKSDVTKNAKDVPAKTVAKNLSAKKIDDENLDDDDIDDIIDQISLDDEGISYFDDEKGKDDVPVDKSPSKSKVKPAKSPSKPVAVTEVIPTKTTPASAPIVDVEPERKNSISVDVGGSSSQWLVP